MLDQDKSKRLAALVEGVAEELGGVDAAFIVFKGARDFDGAAVSISFGDSEEVAQFAKEVGQIVSANAELHAQADGPGVTVGMARIQRGGSGVSEVPLTDKDEGQLDLNQIARLGFAIMEDVVPRTFNWSEGVASLCFALGGMLSLHTKNTGGSREDALGKMRAIMDEVLKNDIQVVSSEESEAMKVARNGGLH